MTIDPQRTVRLTPRESEVLRALARGRTYVQVADALGVSLNTVAGVVRTMATFDLLICLIPSGLRVSGPSGALRVA